MFDSGEMDPHAALPELRIFMAQSANKRAALDELIRSQTDKRSTLFHGWISSEEFGQRFGADQQDIQQVETWLKSSGFQNIRTTEGQQVITFSGSVSQAESAFRVDIHCFLVNGRVHFANLREPALPSYLRSKIKVIQGLDNFSLEAQHSNQQLGLPTSYANSSTAGASPVDLAAAYNATSLYRAGILGDGVKVAIVGAGTVSPQDYRTYRATFGLPQNDFTLVVVPGASINNTSQNDNLEATLDVEIAGGIAPGAQIVYVQDDDIFGSVEYAIDKHLAQVISMSYTSCELPSPQDAAYEMLALQAVTEGITWVNASGDSGAAGCDQAGSATAVLGLAVNLPASVPEVTGVGGTNFTQTVAGDAAGIQESGNSDSTYSSETAWNGITHGQSLLASGGGISKDFFRPSFQSSIDDASGYRHVPDVAFDAGSWTPDYQIFMGGKLLSVGGTSASTPLFAGLLALVDEYLIKDNPGYKSGLGNINPGLYRLAATDPEVFHDVTTGSNEVGCQSQAPDCVNGILGYYAGVGYDMATGLGSVDAYKLATDWSSVTFAESSTSITIVASGGSNALDAMVKVESEGDISNGTVVLQCYNSTYSNDPFEVGRFTLDASGSGSMQVTGLPSGTNHISAVFQGSSSVLGSVSQDDSVVIGPEKASATTVSLFDVPASIESGHSVPLSAAITGSTVSPTGIVNFYFDGSLVGSAEISSGVASTITAAITGATSGLLMAEYAGNQVYLASASASVPLVVTAPLPSTTPALSLAVLATSMGSTNDLTLSASSGGTAIPDGHVQFFANGKRLGGTVLFSNAIASQSFSTAMTGLVLFTAVYEGDPRYQETTSEPVAVTLPAIVATAPNTDFNMIVPATLSLGQGTTPAFPLTIQPAGSAPLSVGLTCTASVPGYSCVLPSTVTVSGNTTVAGSLQAQELSFVIPLALLMCPIGWRRKGVNVMAFSLALLALTGCGLTINNQKAFSAQHTYVLNVTAKAGTVVHTASIVINQS